MIYPEPSRTMEYTSPGNPHDISDVELLEFLVGFSSGSGRNQAGHHQGRGYESPLHTNSCHSTPEKQYHSHHHIQNSQFTDLNPPRPYSMPGCQTPVGQEFTQSNDQILRFREPGEIVDGDNEMESRSSNPFDDVSSTTSGASSNRKGNAKVCMNQIVYPY